MFTEAKETHEKKTSDERGVLGGEYQRVCASSALQMRIGQRSVLNDSLDALLRRNSSDSLAVWLKNMNTAMSSMPVSVPSTK